MVQKALREVGRQESVSTLPTLYGPFAGREEQSEKSTFRKQSPVLESLE
jgi:hypothetical protein